MGTALATSILLVADVAVWIYAVVAIVGAWR